MKYTINDYNKISRGSCNNDYDEISRGTYSNDDEDYYYECMHHALIENEYLYIDMYNNLQIIKEGICILKKK